MVIIKSYFLFPAGIIGNSIGLRGDGFLEFETLAPKFMTVLFSTEEENSMLLIQGNERNFWTVSSKFRNVKVQIFWEGHKILQNLHGRLYAYLSGTLKLANSDFEVHFLTKTVIKLKINLQPFVDLSAF